ncbi:MAG TPA: hypothetical protein VFX33_07825 [Actinomycetales bacterium]|nr:hypothetical protein [Actinomycetales bacterium]
MSTRSTTRWLAGLALSAAIIGGSTTAAVAQGDGDYPPGTPSPTKTSVTPSPTKTSTEVLGNKVTRTPAPTVEVLGAQLPRTGVNVAGAAAVGALLIGTGVAVRTASRRRSAEH